MLSKNKLKEYDEDIDNIETEDIDISKNAYIYNTKTEDIDNTKTNGKDEYIYKGRNRFIHMFRYSKRWKDKKGNCKKRQIFWVFWDDGHVSELCEKWVHYNSSYAYTRFEELRTRSGEVLFTKENEATMSKDESNTYIDIDELQMFRDFSTKDKIATKTKTEDNDNTTTKNGTRLKVCKIR